MKHILFIGLSAILFGASGCGRYSKPEAPKGSFYPHTYFVQSESEKKVSVDTTDIFEENNNAYDTDLDVDTHLRQVKSMKK